MQQVDTEHVDVGRRLGREIGLQIARFQEEATDDALGEAMRAFEYEAAASAAVSVLVTERTARLRAEAETASVRACLVEVESRLASIASAAAADTSVQKVDAAIFSKGLAVADGQLNTALRRADEAEAAADRVGAAAAAAARLAVAAGAVPHLQRAVHEFRANWRRAEQRASDETMAAATAARASALSARRGRPN
jgi:chromosome segregation ATPase